MTVPSAATLAHPERTRTTIGGLPLENASWGTLERARSTGDIYSSLRRMSARRARESTQGRSGHLRGR